MRRALAYGDVVFFVGVYVYCLLHARTGWQYVTGMVVAAAGYSLWFTARAQLGKSFSATPQARELITSGLYSKIGNPIYVFSSIGIVAMCLGMRWYAAGVVYATVVSLMQWRRSRAEAAVLEAKFGEEYREYRERTWF